MKSKKIFLSVVFVIVIASIIGIFITQSAVKKEDKVIEVGAILPLTGSGAELGKYSQDAIVLAEDVINKSGGVLGKKIKVIVEDNRSLPKEGITATQYILSTHPEIKAVFSQLSGVAISISPLLKDKKILHFSMAATPKFLEVSPFNIRNYLSAESIASMASDYIIKMKQKKAVVFYMESEYSSPIAEKFSNNCKEKNVEVELYSFLPDANIQLIRNMISKVLSKVGKESPIFLTGYGPALGSLARELGALKFSGILIVEPTFNFPETLSMIQNVTFDTLLIDIEFSSDNPIEKPEKEFVKNYIAKYNKIPKLSAALIYEAIFLWKLCVETIHSFDSHSLINQMHNLGEIKGQIFQKISVSNRDIKFPLTYKNIRQGKIIE